ncbi:hypothetical protein [Agromyces archimandritae]|uniref:Uncharacterized protein n=1 Tax=Agromyces archimandritae TaxID=2781962 RepID=A0A975IP29_9MICO|nr:hypothetical protein [Agromyces archimandritae]QTX03531.1 hypothetical protein G127AT_09185 [Agromyces archimandritae]
MPSFDGPYASEFRDAWTNYGNPFVHGVIADEEISDAEFAEILARLTTCVEGAGMLVTSHDAHGYRVDMNGRGEDPEPANADLDACDMESGWFPLSIIRAQMQSNPQNEDMNEIMAACMVQNGVVADGYTAKEFARDNPERSFPFLDPKTGDRAFTECQNDPLGLLSGDEK